METVSNRLRWARKQHGLTQRDLAKLTGVGLNTIRRVEQEPESFTPQLGTVEKLASALHIRAGWLAFGEEPMLNLSDMTAETQVVEQTGPGTEGLPGFDAIDGGTW